jgi:hypothetical protein
MDKYGVVTKEPLTKEGSKNTRQQCPHCGALLTDSARHCPECGTKPWEPKPRGKRVDVKG